MPISHHRFSAQASFLASRAANWAGECTLLPEDLQKPMTDDAVQRFTKMLRETAERIDRIHQEPSS